jgi:hypothetical protein
MRLNPRQRAVHALFKTYIDVVHVGKEEGDKLFKQRTGVRCSTAATLVVLPANTVPKMGNLDTSQGACANDGTLHMCCYLMHAS